MTEFIITTKEDLREVVFETFQDVMAKTPAPEPPTTIEKPIPKLEFCKILGITPPTSDRWDRQGKTNRFKIGRLVYYPASDVKRLLNSKK